MTSTLETRPATRTGRRPVARGRCGVAIIGSGFAGLGMAIALKKRGEHDFVVLERADDVGGTWRDNTYPGAACDVQSNLYSFSFAPNPDWPRSYSEQPEIQAYLQATTDRFGVREHCVFGADVTSARWHDEGPALGGADAGRRPSSPRCSSPPPAPWPTRPIPTSRAWTRSPAPSCTPPAGTPRTTSPARRSPSSAPARRPSRSCPPSSRSSTASRSTSGRRPGWSPAPTTR